MSTVIAYTDGASANNQDTQQACAALQAIQQAWPQSSNGPTYGELVALVISTEYYGNRAFEGSSGTGCSGLRLGDVMQLVMAHEFWYWYRQSDGDEITNIVRFLSYYEPIREQEVGGNGFGSLFTDVRGVSSLIAKSGVYAEADLLGYLANIFDNTNPYAVFTASNPGQAASNCPFGFANTTARTSQTYNTDGALAMFPNDFKVVSFAQSVGQAPARSGCSSFENLRQDANCQPQPLSGLPSQ